jgi:NAD-dependent SIR2 family protein deacetylase
MENKNRETKKVITPVDKHEVVLKSFLTGREKREFTNNPDEGFEMIGIRVVVISVNGKTDKISDAILDMHGKDYDFVLNEMAEIINDSSFLVQKTKKE